jgi:hypothetical protein
MRCLGAAASAVSTVALAAAIPLSKDDLAQADEGMQLATAPRLNSFQRNIADFRKACSPQGAQQETGTKAKVIILQSQPNPCRARLTAKISACLARLKQCSLGVPA